MGGRATVFASFCLLQSLAKFKSGGLGALLTSQVFTCQVFGPTGQTLFCCREEIRRPSVALPQGARVGAGERLGGREATQASQPSDFTQICLNSSDPAHSPYKAEVPVKHTVTR